MTSRYEEIRSDIVDRGGVITTSERQGLSIILHKGLSAWIKVWSTVSKKPTMTTATTTVRQIENEHVVGQIVSIMATIALNNEQGIYS